MATIEGYGDWSSPLAAGDVARAKVSLSELCSDGRSLYWLESRPAEAGRGPWSCAPMPLGVSDHSPEGVSIRSRVHEYGEGSLSASCPAGSGRCLLPMSTRRTSGCGSL